MTLDLSIGISELGPQFPLAAAEAIARILNELRVSAEFLALSPEPLADTPESVESVPVRRVQSPSGAYGAVLRAAQQAAQGEWLITLDAPAPQDASLVFTFWHRREEGDLLIASRYIRSGSAHMPLLRKALSRLLNTLYRLGLSVDVRDLSSARRMYRMRLFKKIALTGEDYDVLMESLLKFMSMGVRVMEIPWHFQSSDYRQKPGTAMRLVRSCLATFWRMHSLRNSVNFPDYDSRAYDSRIWLQRWWQRKRYQIVREFIGQPQRALDAGCGGSRIIRTRPEMVAMDINFGRLRFLKPSNPRRVQATVGALPFPDNTFDAVLSSQVIEHTAEDTCISEGARVLRPGGVFVLGTPDYDTLLWPITEKMYGWVKRGGYADEHITHYSLKSLTSELARNGCAIEDYRYIGGGELIIKAIKTPAEKTP